MIHVRYNRDQWKIRRGINVKKRWIGIIGILWFGMLSACDHSVTTIENSSTVQEVYNVIIEQANRLYSATVTISLEHATVAGSGEQVVMKADLTGEMIHQPLKLHQMGSVSFHYPSLGTIDLDAELYVADDHIYFHENMFNHWIKGSVDDLSTFGIQFDEDHSLLTYIEQMEAYLDHFSLKQTTDTFIFTLEISSDQIVEHIIEKIPFFQMTEVWMDEQSNVQEAKHTEIDYTMIIEKDTYNILSFTIERHKNITEHEETVTLRSLINVDFTNINQSDDIIIPQEVIDQATREIPYNF